MRKKTERNQEIVRLFLAGKTYREIGAIYGITYQRVQGILKQAGATLRRVPSMSSEAPCLKLARS